MELSQAQLCLRLIIAAKVFIPSRQHLTSDYLLKLFVLFQVISGSIPPMITGLLEQFMNLNWLIFYLIMVFIIDVVWW
jgi:hypothetical protein